MCVKVPHQSAIEQLARSYVLLIFFIDVLPNSVLAFPLLLLLLLLVLLLFVVSKVLSVIIVSCITIFFLDSDPGFLVKFIINK